MKKAETERMRSLTYAWLCWKGWKLFIHQGMVFSMRTRNIRNVLERNLHLMKLNSLWKDLTNIFNTLYKYVFSILHTVQMLYIYLVMHVGSQRLLCSSHLLNRKFFMQLWGEPRVLIPQLQPLWFKAMWANTFMLLCWGLKDVSKYEMPLVVFRCKYIKSFLWKQLMLHISCDSVCFSGSLD